MCEVMFEVNADRGWMAGRRWSCCGMGVVRRFKLVGSGVL